MVPQGSIYTLLRNFSANKADALNCWDYNDSEQTLLKVTPPPCKNYTVAKPVLYIAINFKPIMQLIYIYLFSLLMHSALNVLRFQPIIFKG